MVSPAKAGSWAYLKELVPDGRGDVEVRPCLKEGYLFPDKGSRELRTFGPTAPVPEKGPDTPERFDNFRPVDRFSPAPLPPFGGPRFEFHRFSVHGEEGVLPPTGRQVQGILAIIPGGLDKLVQDF